MAATIAYAVSGRARVAVLWLPPLRHQTQWARPRN